MNKKTILDNKAQSEAVFRIMVDSIVGFAILIIILSAISYFNDQTVNQSWTDFMDIVKSAANTPDGSIVISKELYFVKGRGVGAIDVQNWTGYPAGCFKFKSKYSSVDISADEMQATFVQNFNTKIYAMCSPQVCDVTIKDSCCIDCVISFGDKLE